MTIWQGVGCGLEAAIVDPKSIWIRKEAQVGDFPHSSAKVNDDGTVVEFESSDRRCIGSVEGNSFIISLVQAYYNRLRDNVHSIKTVTTVMSS
jgi:hypothetical protein